MDASGYLDPYLEVRLLRWSINAVLLDPGERDSTYIPRVGEDAKRRPSWTASKERSMPVKKIFCGLREHVILGCMTTKSAMLLGLVLLCGCATGPVSPGMTLLAGINHYQEEMAVFGARSERWPERQRMGDFLKLTFAAALGRSAEFNRLVDLDQRKREFVIAARDSSLPSERLKELQEEFSKMNEEMGALKAMVKRQIAAVPVAAQEPVKGIEGIATIGLLTLAIDGFSSASNPTGAIAPITKVGSYIVTDMGGSAAVQTPQGQIYRCSTFLVQDEGAGIKCEPPGGKS